MTDGTSRFEMPEPNRYCCEEARDFSNWIDSLFELVIKGENPTETRLYYLLALLTRQFWNVRLTVDGKHRDRVTGKNNRLCLYGVYLQGLKRAFALTLAIPPQELKTEGEEPASPQGIYGLPIGIKKRD